MEEIKKQINTKAKSLEFSKETQVMTVITNTTIRGIVNNANEIGIKRENIVSLLKDNGQFVLVYFK